MIGLDFSSTGEWLRGSGPDSDVVISTRVRLARNIAGFNFANRAQLSEHQQVLALAREHITPACDRSGMLWVDVGALEPLEATLLVERHLISKHLAKSDRPRAAVMHPDESLSIMVNEEDHLRMQVIRSGRQTGAAFAEVNRIDDRLGQRLPFAFHKRFGYLTACPTNVGTGIRFSIMLHLPALMLTKEIERVRRAAQDMQLAIRGFYGEGSDALGDIFQISNQTTLGKTEEQLMREFDEGVMPRVVEYERRARQVLVERRKSLLDDRCFRALGILQNARLLKLDESLRLLSHLRLGVQVGRITGVDPQTIDRLLVLVQPAHLQKALGESLHQAERTEARATLIRQHLS
ncbi:MAG: protein arginine kinase [Phycisphaerales bacterium]|nr:protein arginine kinase [Phycisphaerales bacterium]